jgi:hypothetical protein
LAESCPPFLDESVITSQSHTQQLCDGAQVSRRRRRGRGRRLPRVQEDRREQAPPRGACVLPPSRSTIAFSLSSCTRRIRGTFTQLHRRSAHTPRSRSPAPPRLRDSLARHFIHLRGGGELMRSAPDAAEGSAGLCSITCLGEDALLANSPPHLPFSRSTNYDDHRPTHRLERENTASSHTDTQAPLTPLSPPLHHNSWA